MHNEVIPNVNGVRDLGNCFSLIFSSSLQAQIALDMIRMTADSANGRIE